jgi:predicted RNA-binding protein with TRAM domain
MGGGAYITASGTVSLEDVTIEDTGASGDGGGLCFSNSSTVSSTVSRLSITDAQAGGSGNGAYIDIKGFLQLVAGTKINNTTLLMQYTLNAGTYQY